MKLDINKNLHNFTLHPITNEYSYTDLTLSGSEIDNLDEIQVHQDILNLCVSNNNICSLEPLQNLPLLMKIDARGNNLSACVDYTPSSSFRDFKKVGSLLTVLDVSQNRIDHICNLENHPYLTHINLSYNLLRNTVGFTALKFLQVLDLSNNNIEEIDGLTDLPLKELYLQSNKIQSIDGLRHMKYLSILDISHNQLQSIESLQHLTQLVTLNICGNQLQDLSQIDYLISIPWLMTLNMSYNPISVDPAYREVIILKLDGLETLDNIPIESEEKIIAAVSQGQSGERGWI